MHNSILAHLCTNTCQIASMSFQRGPFLEILEDSLPNINLIHSLTKLINSCLPSLCFPMFRQFTFVYDIWDHVRFLQFP